MCATACAADWEIVSVSATPFGKNALSGSADLQLEVLIRNVSRRTIYVPGQRLGRADSVPAVEYFARGDNDVWEKQTVAGSGLPKAAEWLVVAPGETIRHTKLFSEQYVGRQFLMTFRLSHSKYDTDGIEILVGPFAFPKPRARSPSGYQP